ncbi:unnamed protein product [Mycetohabitans rhizoxinica HKI 454]|uniref:Uncharacterized protein n=1 Tax=Mycetohabitans rhizoxinica (strain DSM 19002 / CIP 109453 / HKI 454) TaxID=882378 RepID=E5AMF8_MYCRK|nr:unnamed protein product [Mycetohabitans rhizoxinica HKI 454]
MVARMRGFGAKLARRLFWVQFTTRFGGAPANHAADGKTLARPPRRAAKVSVALAIRSSLAWRSARDAPR